MSVGFYSYNSSARRASLTSPPAVLFVLPLTANRQVGHGKAIYQLGGISPDCSVLDLKRRLELLTGVPFVRQKLLFKGVLRDGDLVGATKIVEGAKVMLLGAPPPAAAAKK